LHSILRRPVSQHGHCRIHGHRHLGWTRTLRGTILKGSRPAPPPFKRVIQFI
jgi:hypothetical protein